MFSMAVSPDPLAAAVAAAAELARSGSAFGVSSPLTSMVSSLEASSECATTKRSRTTSTSSTSTSSSSSTSIHTSTDARAASTSCVSESDHFEDDDDDLEEEEEDVQVRMARSRERNREHARRTRLRKKAQLEALQSKVKGLQAESQVLKQSLEECSIASILMGLSQKTSAKEDKITQSLLQVASFDDSSSSCHKDAAEIMQLVGGKRKRFVAPDLLDHKAQQQPLQLKINGKTTLIGGGKTHINWKTGVYSDEQGHQRKLTQKQLESLRRERNRMHAKMTRDRKKHFIAIVEKTIHELESSNTRMKQVLADVVETHFPQRQDCPVTPDTYVASEEIPPIDNLQDFTQRPAKKTCLAFPSN